MTEQADEAPITLRVDLPAGPVSVSAAYGRPTQPWASIAVAHGAGSRLDSPLVVGFTASMRARGVATLRFNFPYSEAGRRPPGPAAHAIAAWRAAMGALAEHAEGEPLWAAGRSYGGRMASMASAAGDIEPAGLVYLSYPLHPPGRPDALRTEHLPSIAAPQLFVSGRTDPFVDPHDQLENAITACRGASLIWVDGGHSYEVKGRRRSPEQISTDLADLVAPWMRSQSGRIRARTPLGGDPVHD